MQIECSICQQYVDEVGERYEGDPEDYRIMKMIEQLAYIQRQQEIDRICDVDTLCLPMLKLMGGE